MADIIENQEIQTQEQQTIDAKAELAQFMGIAMNNGIVPEVTQTENTETSQQQATTTETFPPAITFESIKDKFGYQSPEDAIKEIEELRVFKATPPKAEFKFEDETSEKLFKAWQAGKRQEVKKYLDDSDLLDKYTTSEISKENAPDIIKLGIHLKHPDLTTQEIEFEYKEKYSIPKAPTQKTEETDDEFAERTEAWKEVSESVEMKRIIAAKMAKPELEASRSKLTVPEIPTTVDDNYVNWKKLQESYKAEDAALAKIYETYKDPKVIETKLNFNDEANKIQFSVQYQPTVEELKKATEWALDIDSFVSLFIRPDGSPDREGFLRALHIAANSDKVITSVANQAKNGTLKAQLPNNSGGVIRQLPQTQEVSEFDAQMQRALNGYGNGVRR